MANTPFNTFVLGLPAAGTLTGAEILPVEKTGVSSQTTTGAIAALASGGILAAGWNSTSGAIPVSLAVPQDVIIPYGCTLKEVYILTQGAAGASVSGSCTVTLGTLAFSGVPGAYSDITGGVQPALVTTTAPYSNTTLTSWTTSFSQNAVIRATLTANTAFQSVKIFLRFQ